MTTEDTETTEELQAVIRALRANARKDAAEIERLTRQIDEARKELKHIGEYGTEEINAAVELRQQLASALVERDEAREALRDYRKMIEEDGR